MFVRQIVNPKAGFPNSSEQYTKILGMLRRLTYIRRFFGRTPYVVPSAFRPKAMCRVAQARISRTSVEELHAMLWNDLQIPILHRPFGLREGCSRNEL